jgi:hypothetical protein
MAMKALLIGAAFFFTTASAFAQVPVYTNADLGKPLKHPHKTTPEEFRSIVAHQFVYVPKADRDFEGPRVTIVPYTPPAQYPVPPTYPLDPSWYNLPPYYPFVYYGGGSGAYRGSAGVPFRERERMRRGGGEERRPERPMSPPPATGRPMSPSPTGIERRR